MAETLFAEVPEEAGVDESYRPVSGLAVAGFAVSLLSAAALFGAVLWSVPALAIVLNLAALRHIAVTSRTGVRLARTGLVISFFFLSAAIGYESWREFSTRRQAQRVADQWLQAMLDGNVQLAHQLTLSPNQRQADIQGLPKIYAGSTALAKELQGFEQIETVRQVAQARGKDPTIRLRSRTLGADSRQESVTLRYELQYQDRGEPQTIAVTLPLLRELAYSPHVVGWRVQMYSLAAAMSETHDQTGEAGDSDH